MPLPKIRISNDSSEGLNNVESTPDDDLPELIFDDSDPENIEEKSSGVDWDFTKEIEYRTSPAKNNVEEFIKEQSNDTDFSLSWDDNDDDDEIVTNESLPEGAPEINFLDDSEDEEFVFTDESSQNFVFDPDDTQDDYLSAPSINEAPNTSSEVFGRFDEYKENFYNDNENNEQSDQDIFAKPLSKKDVEPIDDEDDDENEVMDDSVSDKVSIKELLLGPFKIFKLIYTLFVKVMFSVVYFVLKILSKLPLIGGLFSTLLGMTKIIEKIAIALPVVGLLALIVVFNIVSVPSSTSVDLPDFGSAKLYDMQINVESGEITAKLENTGVTIINVTPEFEVKSNIINLNPMSWIKPKTISECAAPETKVSIEKTVDISFKCKEFVSKGQFIRVTGNINE